MKDKPVVQMTMDILPQTSELKYWKRGTSAATHKRRHSNFSANERNRDGQIREQVGPSLLMYDIYLI